LVRRALRTRGPVVHGLAGAVAVDPALHGRPRDLESGGDLTDRPALLDDELGNLQTVTRCEGSVGMGHGIFRSGTAPRHPAAVRPDAARGCAVRSRRTARL